MKGLWFSMYIPRSDLELDSSLPVLFTHSLKLSTLPTFDLPISNGTVPLGSETPRKNALIPKDAFVVFVKPTIPSGFLGRSTPCMRSLPQRRCLILRELPLFTTQGHDRSRDLIIPERSITHMSHVASCAAAGLPLL